METFLNILEKTSPSIVALIIVYLGYRVWLKQKAFEEENEKLREIRQSISNLLLIWKELSKFERNLNPNDPYNEILFSNSKILRKFLKIDSPKIDRLKKSYIESINNLRSYEISIFYSLESSFESYNNSFNELLNPILTDKSINITNKYKLVYPLLQDTVKELEEIIIETSKYLSKNERKTVLDILYSHSEEINKPQDFEEIPEFIVEIVNSFLPMKEEITKNDFFILYKNKTVRWLILKVINTNLISFLFNGNPFEIFKILLLLFNNENLDKLNEISERIDNETILDLLTITEIESDKFVNNKEFYSLIMGLIKKIEGKVPYEIKRIFVKLNNGEVDLKRKLEELKLQITPVANKG